MNKSIKKTLFLVVLAEVIGFGIVIPILPLLFTEPSSQFFILPEQLTVETGYILLGVLIGLYPIGQFVSTPILGELSDIYGRKKVMTLSILGTVVSNLIFAAGLFTANIPLLFLSRSLNGLTGGLISVAQATIADISDDSNRAANFGLIGAAFGTGFIFGPFLGGLLSSGMLPLLNVVTPFVFASVLSSLSILYLRHSLEETSPMEDKKVKWSKPFTQLKKGLKIPGLKKLFGVNFLYFSGFSFFTTFIPVYLVRVFEFRQFQTGNFFLYLGIFILITQLGIIPKLFPRFKEENVMPKTLFLTGMFIILQLLPNNLYIFLAVVPLFAISNGITQVTLNTLISKNAPKKDQGLALGTNQSIRSIANAGPSILSGVAAAAFTPTTPLFIAGTIIVVGATVYIVSERR